VTKMAKLASSTASPPRVDISMNQKSKMVSFRLSAEDYQRLREACVAAGIQNVSELARSAMNRIIEDKDSNHFTLDSQVRELREKVRHITLELDRLDTIVTKSKAAQA
jgi:predicted DNA-binding protein